MANKVLAFLEKVGSKIEIVAVDVFKGTEDAIKVLTDAKDLAPEVKSGIQTLITDGEALSAAAVAAGVAEGGNFASDATAVLAAQKLVKDFLAFLPVLKSAAAKIVSDVK